MKNPPTMQETRVRSPGGEDTLEKGMATLSPLSILAWRVPWTGEPGGLQGCKESDTTEQLRTHSTQRMIITLQGSPRYIAVFNDTPKDTWTWSFINPRDLLRMLAPRHEKHVSGQYLQLTANWA